MKRMPSLLAVAAVAAAVACSDSFTPSNETVVGDYSLQTLMTTDPSGTTDWVAAGATLTISLETNGTTTGHLFLPGAATGGSDIDADLAGTWSLSDGVITFTQTADTFVRDIDFIAGKDRISGDRTFGSGASATRVRIVVVK